MASLGWYLNDAQQIVHDQNYLFTSKKQAIRWVNLARRELARRTGCVQRLILGQSGFGTTAQPGSIVPGAMQPGALPGANPGASFGASTNGFMTITGLERYPYAFVNPYLTAQYAGVSHVQDVITVAVSWGGSMRPVQDWLPWDVLQARARAFQVLVTSFPFWWSTFNDGEQGEVWLYPVPNQPMEMEWQCFCVPSDLRSDDDFDAIPDGFSNAVKYYVAAMQYLARQRHLDAQLMMQQFDESAGLSRVAADRGKSPSYYSTSFGR